MECRQRVPMVLAHGPLPGDHRSMVSLAHVIPRGSGA
jgi:hypothetical protein